MEEQVEIIFIPIAHRRSSQDIIPEIFQAIFGSVDEVSFAETFVPLTGRVPEPRARNFTNYLMNAPRLLWGIRVNGETVGFILVSDRPFQNALGMSINSRFAGRGIMAQALNKVLASKELVYPIYGYTSERNTPARSLLERAGFEKDDKPVSFLGESSIRYALKSPPAENNLIITFGDIHGCYPAAAKAVEISEELGAKVIFLGDYVDRGPSAVKTLRSLIRAKENHPDWLFLRGNHEQMLLDLIMGTANPSDIGAALNLEFDYSQAARSFQEWKGLNAYGKKEIHDFLNQTILYHETTDFIFCHATLRDTSEEMGKKPKEELIWNYSYEPVWTGKRFVHGHLPVKQVTEEGRGININTSCGYGGVLTGLIINESDPDNYEYIQIHENGSLVKP